MDYKKLTHDCESALEVLSKKTFDSLNEAFIEVTKLWKQILGQQSGRIIPLLEKSNVLLYGIEEKTVSNKDVPFLLRLFRLGGKKTVYGISKKSIVLKALGVVCQEAQTLDDEVNSYLNQLAERHNASTLPPSSPSSLAKGTIPESRFYNLAASYQRILMHTYEMKEEDYAAAIRKDARVALHGQGMNVVEYNGDNDILFDVREDSDCESPIMISPSIIRSNDNMIVAKGVVFKP